MVEGVEKRMEGLNESSNGIGAVPKLYVRVTPQYIPTRSDNAELDQLIYVNDDENPILINNEHFTGYVVFRVRNFHGWTPLDEKTGRPKLPILDCPHYFDGHKRTFGLHVSGRFRKPWSGDDIMFGTFFDRPIKLPRGSGIALAFAQRIDPSMTYENNDTPYICSPIICAMNTVHIQPLLAPARSSITEKSPRPASPNRTSPGIAPASGNSLFEAAVRSKQDAKRSPKEPLTLPPWKYGGPRGEHLEENLMAAWPSWTIATGGNQVVPGSANSVAGTQIDGTMNSALIKAVSKNKISPAHRRQWFLDEKHRQRFIFHPDTVYSFDFASPYVDMNEIVLKLGINISVPPYLDGQPVRYECRTRDGSIIFWTLELGLK